MGYLDDLQEWIKGKAQPPAEEAAGPETGAARIIEPDDKGKINVVPQSQFPAWENTPGYTGPGTNIRADVPLNGDNQPSMTATEESGPQKAIYAATDWMPSGVRQRVQSGLGNLYDFSGAHTLYDVGSKLAHGDQTGAQLGIAETLAGVGAKPAKMTAAIARDMIEKTLLKAKPLGELEHGAPTLAQDVVRRTLDPSIGGATVDPVTGAIPTEGLMVGKFANNDPRNLVLPASEFTPEALQAHMAKNAKNFTTPGTHLGTWVDNGKVYVDASKQFPPSDLRAATKFGERTGQMSLYDIGKGEVKPIGNFGDFMQSPEYQQRLEQMAREGRDYLDKHPAKEWWDTHGTSFERVYGEDKLPHVAGFSAATAPNEGPIRNMQTMTEYMRRHQAGEPTVQPEFRIGDNRPHNYEPEELGNTRVPLDEPMTYQRGVKMPMETGRANNLNKAAAGDLEVMQREKVQNEARAMAGDPTAVVLDRHHIRLGEDPEKGIYGMAQADALTGPAYQKMVDAISLNAARAGRNPRDYSADVWTGIRNRLQSTGDLYGQKFNKNSITGESKSYSDHFDDLIKQKADQLGITPREVESHLRTGNINLLSHMLSHPGMSALLGGGAAGTLGMRMMGSDREAPRI